MVENDKYSTLLSSANVTPPPGVEDVPNAPNATYKSVEFGPTGGASLDAVGGALGGDKWFVSLKTEIDPENDSTHAKNFITMVIDPITGRLKTFQP